MAKVTATLSQRVDARGKSEILLRFVGGRDHVHRLHSRLYIHPSRWKDGGVVIPRLGTEEQKELKALKERLEDLVRFILDEFQKSDAGRVTRETMQEAVDRFHHPERRGNGDFFDLFDRFRESKRIGRLRGLRYKTTVLALRRFEAVRGRRITVGGLDQDFLDEFRAFLFDEHRLARAKKNRAVYGEMERIPEERGENTVIDYLKVLRAFFGWLAKQGELVTDPFASFEIGTPVYGTPYYLTLEELELLERTSLSHNPSLAAQRDIFVFQCLVGCRVGDLVKLKKGDIVDGVLSYIPRKTVDERPMVVRVPLNHTAAEIVARYADLPGQKLLPFITTQKYNDAIKRIFVAAGLIRLVSVLDPVNRKEVKRPLNEVASSHLARRTFVGNLYKQVADPNIIGAMSGHSEGSRAFSRYRSIDDEMKAGVVEKLDTKKRR